MELAALVCAILALLLALGAITLSCWNTIHIQAQRLSTHTVIPVAPESTTMSNIEQEISKIVKGAGGDYNDLNRNLNATGLDPDDLV